MAKKDYTPASTTQISSFGEDILKSWGRQAIHGVDIRDENLQTISTGSTKLDWALGRPFVEGSINEIHGENGTGKAQPVDSTVMTPSGPVQMGDIKLGDIVLTPTGCAEVIGVYPQGEIDVYKVIFSDGSSTECCANHLWNTRTLQDRAHNRPGSIKNTVEVMSSLRRQDGAKNHMIPMAGPANFSSKELLIEPYLLGLLLGDGYIPKKYSLMFSSGDEELVSCCNSLLSNYECRLNHSAAYDYRIISSSGNRSGSSLLRQLLKELDLLGRKSDTKFIPQEYLISSVEQRLSLLRGLMDTDGTVGIAGNTTFSSASARLAHGVKFLVQSLGGRATISSRIPHFTYLGKKKSGKVSYRVNITMTLNPFLLNRKASLFNKFTYTPKRLISSVEYVGRKQAQCIRIDSPDHLYLTDEFIVTHNTTVALEVAASATLLGKPVYFFDLERKLTEAQINMISRLKRELFWRIRPDNGEDAVNKVHKCVSEIPGCVVIFDSITQMLPEVEDAEDAEKQTMGTVARLAAKMVRKITGPVERNRCMVLFISHITTNMNPYASGDTTKGGKAVPDIASQRVRLKRLSVGLLKDKSSGDIIGQMTKCKIIKNNQTVPFREVEVPIIYGRGIDRGLDLLQLARDLSIIDYEKKGWYLYVEPELFGTQDAPWVRKREAEMIEILQKNPKYRKAMLAKVKEMLA